MPCMCACLCGFWNLLSETATMVPPVDGPRGMILRVHALRPWPDSSLCCCAEGCPTLTNMLVIIVGGIPIAMPTVLSVTLALGAYKLAKEGAIVARMSAVEEMAGMDILCSDKTGAHERPHSNRHTKAMPMQPGSLRSLDERSNCCVR